MKENIDSFKSKQERNDQDFEKSHRAESIERNEATGGEVLAGLILITGGCFAAKKVWEHNIGGIQEKTNEAASDMFEMAFKKAKSNFDIFLNGSEVDFQTESAFYKKEQGVDAVNSTFTVEDEEDDSNQNEDQDENLDIIRELLKKSEEIKTMRKKSISDVDSELAREIGEMDEKHTEKLTDFIEKLSPEERSVMSSAYISSEIAFNNEPLTEDDWSEWQEEFDKLSDLDKTKFFVLLIEEQTDIQERLGIKSILRVPREFELIATRRALNRFQEMQKIQNAENMSNEDILKNEYKKLIEDKNAMQRKLLEIVAKLLKS